MVFIIIVDMVKMFLMLVLVVQSLHDVHLHIRLLLLQLVNITFDLLQDFPLGGHHGVLVVVVLLSVLLPVVDVPSLASPNSPCKQGPETYSQNYQGSQHFLLCSSPMVYLILIDKGAALTQFSTGAFWTILDSSE